MKRKRFFIATIMVAFFTCCFAIPSKRKPFVVEQSDGTRLTLTLIGDESFHYYATTDGMPVVESEGSYYYATLTGKVLTATDLLAHNSDMRSQSEAAQVSAMAQEVKDRVSDAWSSRMRKRNAARARKVMNNDSEVNESRARRALGRPAPYVGKKKGLVILVQFPDLKFKNDHTRDEYNDMFNKVGYTNNDNSGSVHDYFYAQSYGKFNLEFDVIGPYTTAKKRSYYGQNDREGNDMHVCELVQEICDAASDDINFSLYDWNGDSEIEQVYIVYAGPGEHTGAGDNYIWPHEWTLDDGKESLNDGTGAIYFGDYKINTYAMSCELVDKSSSYMDGIGTACHEFSHCLGLPDVYCTNSEDYAFAMHVYDPMCMGASNGPYACGEAPCGYTAYERWFAGWLDPVELTEPCTVTNMPCLGDAPIAYVIFNDGNSNEYFFLENRQDTDPWYKYAYCHTGISGLLIYHVDYNEDAWEYNEVNYSHTHQRMSVVPSGKSYGTKSGSSYSVEQDALAKQLFPGSKNVTKFTDDSHTNYGGKLFNKNTDGTYYLHKPITDIKEKDGLISFKFMGGGVEMDCTGIADVTTDNNTTEYFTLSGTKTTPSNKGVYLVRKNGVTKKVIIK